jgi:hypothetical protein
MAVNLSLKTATCITKIKTKGQKEIKMKEKLPRINLENLQVNVIFLIL